MQDLSFEQQTSVDSNVSDTVPLMVQKMPQRPSIVIDSSQLPIQQEFLRKEESKDGLHMQSETMCWKWNRTYLAHLSVTGCIIKLVSANVVFYWRFTRLIVYFQTNLVVIFQPALIYQTYQCFLLPFWIVVVI